MHPYVRSLTTVMTYAHSHSVSYRPPATPPRGRWARFLHQMRKEREWSQQQGFEALRDGLHFGPKSRASYIAIDMGHRPPTAGEQDFLIRYFGKSPDDVAELGDPEEVDPVVAAIDRQTAMLKSVLDALVARSLEPELAKALSAWGMAQATTDTRLRSGGRSGESLPPAPNP
jgi:hypothetical protein